MTSLDRLVRCDGMARRRRILVFLLLAAPLVGAPIGLAVGKPVETLDGTLLTWHGDTFTTPVGVGAGVDTTVAGLVPLDAADAAVHALAGKRVRARGHRRADGVFVASDGVQASGEGAAVAVTGTKTVAVVLMNFSNDTAQPWTSSTVRGVVFDNTNSVDAFFQDASYGQLALTGDVYGWYTIDASNAGCAYTTWASQARSEALAAGVDLDAYEHTVYAFPTTSCAWAGLAYLPGTESWINGAVNLRVVSHELSHNFGVHHASTLACSSGGTPTTFSGTCTQNEYGDPNTVMGTGYRLHNNWHRAQLGWFADTSTATTSGSYLLTPVELTGTPRLLRVARGDGTYLNLEFRQPWGVFDNFSASDPVVNGVSIRIAPSTSSIVQSQLVDTNPSTASFTDAPLGVGQSVTDPVTGISITTVSVGPAGALISIDFGSDGQAPGAPGSLSATAAGPTSVQLGWTAATDNVGVAGYNVYRDGALVGTTSALSHLDSGLQPATAYAYELRAYDAAGNVGPAVAATATTLSAADTAAPSVPTGVTATRMKGRKLRLSWNASTDNVGVVGYTVFRDGVQIATMTGTSYTYRPPRGTFTYQVQARDAAGNVSDLSAVVTFTR